MLFLIGHRSKEIIENLLGEDYAGWLMSDGYAVYRAYLKRVRCWAHLQRKAKGSTQRKEDFVVAINVGSGAGHAEVRSTWTISTRSPRAAGPLSTTSRCSVRGAI